MQQPATISARLARWTKAHEALATVGMFIAVLFLLDLAIPSLPTWATAATIFVFYVGIAKLLEIWWNHAQVQETQPQKASRGFDRIAKAAVAILVVWLLVALVAPLASA